MYIPKHFADQISPLEIIESYHFATLVTENLGAIEITHLPLVLNHQKTLLVGHMAAANPHAALLSQGQSRVLFHGPHAYISPTLYEENDVPTWNYLSVHVTGKVEVFRDRENLLSCLNFLAGKMDSQWKFFIPDDLRENLERAIVGFTVALERVESKAKLSQNRSTNDRQRVRQALASSANSIDQELAQWMERVD